MAGYTNIAETVRRIRPQEGLAEKDPDYHQTAVDAGVDPDLDKPGVAGSVGKGVPDILGGAAGTFDTAGKRTQARLDAIPAADEIAAQGPISRILAHYGD